MLLDKILEGENVRDVLFKRDIVLESKNITKELVDSFALFGKYSGQIGVKDGKLYVKTLLSVEVGDIKFLQKAGWEYDSENNVWILYIGSI